MPELPEVETIRATLSDAIVGKTISTVEILEKKQFVGDSQEIIGAKIVQILRKGKYLSIQLSTKDNTKSLEIPEKNKTLFLNIHLKMSGQILYVESLDNPVVKNTIPKQNTNRLPIKYTRVIINFDDNSAIFYNDMRKFGWLKIAHSPDGPTSADVFSDEFTLEYFQKVTYKSKQQIKSFLLDQTKLAGIGNIYANDALWQANIYPERITGDLSQVEITKLFHAIRDIIAEGVKYRGSSAKDENYILPDGSLGGYQNHFKVYHRTNQPCLTCNTPIKRLKQNGRSSFYCEKCQN